MVAPLREQLQELSLYRSRRNIVAVIAVNIVAVITQDSVINDNLKGKLKPNFVYLQIIPTNPNFSIY